MKSSRALFVLLLLLSACAEPPAPAPVAAPAAEAPKTEANDPVAYAKSLAAAQDAPRKFRDGSSFVRHVFLHTRGVRLPRTPHDISRIGKRIKEADLQPGDLVFYSTLGKPFSHVGIFTGDGQFIHSPGGGKPAESARMNLRYWRERYNGARRIEAHDQ